MTEPTPDSGDGPTRGTWLVIAAVLAAVAALVVVLFAMGDGDDAAERSSPTPPTFDDTAPEATTTTAEESTSTSASTTTSRPTGTDPAITLQRVADLPAPTSVVDLGDGGSVLVSTLDGRVHALDLGSGATEVVLDLRTMVAVGGERGLLGMAADPNGERLYVNFTGTDGDTDVRSWPLADGRPQGGPGDGVLHLEVGQPFSNHNGGNLVFGPDGLLWVGTGDGGSSGDPQENAQDPSSLLGKMLRVAPVAAGGVEAPSSNPAWGGRPEVWGIGLRNPWRYSFDRVTGQLWIGDVGQNAVEEVSVVDPGATSPNFGWDDVEGDADFEGTADPAFVPPVVTYRHADGGCSITGGHVYRGDAVPSLYGWYLFGDYCGRWIRAFPADDPGSGVVELVPDAGVAISFAELADGELLFLSQNGLSRIVAG